MTLAEAVSKRINKLLFEKGMSLYRLSKKSEIPMSTLKNLSNGHIKNPGFALIYKLAAAFDLSLIEFIDCEELLNNPELDYE